MLSPMAMTNDSKSVDRRTYLAKQYRMTPEQVDVVRNAICVGATDAELEFFLATCRRVDLDPFARQIWFVKRKQKQMDARGNDLWVDVGRPETGIDGYRTIAERSGQYRGQAPTMWCGSDGKWMDVWLEAGPPMAARVEVFRDGFTQPLVSVALYREYVAINHKTGKPMGLWDKMPANQLAKCAEAGALRRAWPRDLSGLVTSEEMEHVDSSNEASYSAPAAPAKVDSKTKPALAPAKQSTASQIVDAAPDTARDAAPTKEQVTAELSETARRMLDELPLEVTAEIDVMLHEISEATTLESLTRVGTACSKARKGSEPRDKLIMTLVWPPFEKKYRAIKAEAAR